MSETHEKAPSDDDNTENAISDALASLSLTTELDSALLDHLNLLDKYMFHKECLSQLFRMAFFELAQAKRDKSASGGTRIGESGYDQRMQATRRICLDPESADVYMLKNFSKVDDTTEKSKEGDNVKLVDPVRWYGLLSPQSLRDAQSRFVQVLEESIEVANAMAKLHTSEIGIINLRQKREAKVVATTQDVEEKQAIEEPAETEQINPDQLLETNESTENNATPSEKEQLIPKDTLSENKDMDTQAS